MGYSKACKLFWKTGFKLFCGRFISFKGGRTNKGRVNEGENVSGTYSADDLVLILWFLIKKF